MNTLRRDLRSFRQLCSQQPLILLLFVASLVITAEANSQFFAPSRQQCEEETVARLAAFTAPIGDHRLVFDDRSFHVGGVSLRSRLSLARGEGRAELSVTGARVSAEIFAVLGVKPVLGRNYFLPRESIPGGTPVVLISSRMWKRHFRGSLDALGDTMILNGKAHTVVGILPTDLNSRALGLFEGVDLWVPMGALVSPPTLEDSYIAG